MSVILKKQRRLDIQTAPVSLKLQRTPQGGLLASATPTRCGVLTYTYPGGRKVRELRHPDEVFRSDSLESLRGAPITVGHPDVPVDASNWSELSKGHVGDDVHQDGLLVAAKVRVQDAKTVERCIDAARADRLVEMSCGYDADVEFTPGTWNGEEYDAVQRNIRYNHVALGPRNWGRAGNAVGLKLDGESGIEIASPYTYLVNHIDQADGATPKQDSLTFDAKDFVKRAEHDAEVAKRDSRIAELESQVAKQTKRADSAEAQVAPAALDALVAERQSIVDTARSVCGKDFKADGKSAHEIRLEALKTARPTLKLDGKSEAYVAGAFESLRKDEAAAEASHGQVAETVNAQRADAAVDEESPADKARREMVKRNQTMFQTNGSH